MIFADDFETLETSRWYVSNITRSDNNVLVPEAVTVDNGNLRIQAEYAGGYYRSGQVDTQTTFQFLYGYAEARVRFPQGNGFWTGYFLLSQPWPPEVDFEDLGGNGLYLTVHAGTPENHIAHTMGRESADGYHVYAIKWTQEAVTYIRDGLVLGRITEDVPAHAMSLFFSFYIGKSSDWCGAPDENTVFPNSLDVDWVRVYQRI